MVIFYLCLIIIQLTLNVRSLPTLTGSESYSCIFSDTKTGNTIDKLDAVVDGSNVTCSTPPISSLPDSLPGKIFAFLGKG